MSFQGSRLTFHEDGTYEYHYSPGCDICMTPPVDACNKGKYIKHKNLAYYLYSTPDRDPLTSISLSGKEEEPEDSLSHLTIIDSVRSKNKWTVMDFFRTSNDLKQYYYIVRIVYSRKPDSVRLAKRWELYAQYYNADPAECVRHDSLLIEKFKKEDEQCGLTVVNSTYFQQFICYDQLLDFAPVKGFSIESIEIEVHPIHREHSFSNYTDGFAHCIYTVQQSNSSQFTLMIPEAAYQIIHNPYYDGAIVEIVNEKTIVFDRQAFFKLPKNKKKINHISKHKDHPKTRNSFGSFYGGYRLYQFEKKHKINLFGPYDD